MNKKIIFVADAFANQYAGGAELSTEALLSECPWEQEPHRINSNDVTLDRMKNDKDAIWIFTNIANLEDSQIFYAIKNLDYFFVEYDYKFCKFRSVEKHSLAEKSCNCEQERYGKLIAAFIYSSKKTWFMSESQKRIYTEKFNVLSKKGNIEVLSSLFLKGDLKFMENISNNEKNEKYIILNSNSWIKGTQACISYAKDNNIEYELVNNLSYIELLIKLSTSKGLIFLPLGGDTCPRLVIEAKLLNCDLILNENVQHKNEEWFGLNIDGVNDYLSGRVENFWKEIGLNE
tara:strand:+ start:13718 stop:14584 length:867 start_codon:yes stop_codon:yes gene_type:complete